MVYEVVYENLSFPSDRKYEFVNPPFSPRVVGLTTPEEFVKEWVFYHIHRYRGNHTEGHGRASIRFRAVHDIDDRGPWTVMMIGEAAEESTNK